MIGEEEYQDRLNRLISIAICRLSVSEASDVEVISDDTYKLILNDFRVFYSSIYKAEILSASDEEWNEKAAKLADFDHLILDFLRSQQLQFDVMNDQESMRGVVLEPVD